MRFAWFVWGVLAASVLPSQVFAQDVSVLNWQRDGQLGTITLVCNDVEVCTGGGCDFGTSCQELATGLNACLPPLAGLVSELTPICCDPDPVGGNVACPNREGRSGQCEHLFGDIHICVWPTPERRPFNFCQEIVSGVSRVDIDQVAACFEIDDNGTDPVFGAFTAGDCDEDGTPNGMEPNTDAICDPDVPNARDLGVIDIPDFGASSDLGALDGGQSGVDAGSSSPAGAGFQGGGGCAAAPARSTPPVVALALLGLLAFRRRR